MNVRYLPLMTFAFLGLVACGSTGQSTTATMTSGEVPTIGDTPADGSTEPSTRFAFDHDFVGVENGTDGTVDGSAVFHGATPVDPELALEYTPAFAASAAPTLGSTLGNGGVTGLFVSYEFNNGPVVLDHLRIQQHDDGTLTLRLGDDNEHTLAQSPDGRFPNTYFGQRVVLRTDVEGDTIWRFALDEVGGGDLSRAVGDGFAGIETQISDLPSGSATYYGGYEYTLYSPSPNIRHSTDQGQIIMNVDFGTGAIDGQMADLISTGPDNRVTSTFNDVGTLSGQTSGNGLRATITFADEYAYSGTAELVGKSFGSDAGIITGVLASHDVIEDSTGEAHKLGGTFNTNLVD